MAEVNGPKVSGGLIGSLSSSLIQLAENQERREVKMIMEREHWLKELELRVRALGILGLCRTFSEITHDPLATAILSQLGELTKEEKERLSELLPGE